MRHWTGMFGEQIFEANYEHIVADSEQEIIKLLRYCGLEQEDACFEFHKNKRAVRTASVGQVRQPIYKDSIKASTPYVTYLKPLIEVLESQEDSWDGTLATSSQEAPDGVYYYILSYCRYDGEQVNKTGYITLIR